MDQPFSDCWGKLPTDGDLLKNGGKKLYNVPIPPTWMVSKYLGAYITSNTSTSSESEERESFDNDKKKEEVEKDCVIISNDSKTSASQAGTAQTVDQIETVSVTSKGNEILEPSAEKPLTSAVPRASLSKLGTKGKEVLTKEEINERKRWKEYMRKAAMTEEEKEKEAETRRLDGQKRRAEFAEKERQANLSKQRGNLTEAERKFIDEVEQKRFHKRMSMYLRRQAHIASRGRMEEMDEDERLKLERKREISRIYQRKRIRNETPLQRQKRLAIARKYIKPYSELPEHRKVKIREYWRKKTREETPEQKQARLARYKRNTEKRKQLSRLMDGGISKEEAEVLLRLDRPELFPSGIRTKPSGRPRSVTVPDPDPRPDSDFGRKQKKGVEKFVEVTGNSDKRSKGNDPDPAGKPERSNEGHVENVIPVNSGGFSSVAKERKKVVRKSGRGKLPIPTVTLEAEKKDPATSVIASSAPLTLKPGIKTYERKRFACDVCGKKFATEKLSQAHFLQEHETPQSNECESDCLPSPSNILGADKDVSVSIPNPLANETVFSPPSSPIYSAPSASVCDKDISVANSLANETVFSPPPSPVSALSPSGSVNEPDQENFDRSENEINPLGDEDVDAEVQDETKEVEQPTNSKEKCDTVKSGEENLTNLHKGRTKTPKFVCEVCKKAYVQERNYNVHIRDSHSEPGEKSYFCPAKECSRTFSYAWSANSHYYTSHCRSFGSKKKKGKEGGQGSTVCAYCGKRFSDSFTLSRHVRDLHPAESEKADQVRNICEYCSKEFKHRCTLDDHIRRVHLGMSNKCDVCGRCFQSAVKLLRHKVDSHKMDLDLSAVGKVQVKLCPFCGECVFRGLQAHVQKRHPERVEEYFANGTGRIRDRSREKKRSLCELCNKTYTGTGTAKRQLHNRVHHPELYHPENADVLGPNIKCGICQRKLLTEKWLTWHILTRHHERIELKLKADPEDGPLTCQFCSSPQVEEGAYMRHILNDHPEDFTTFVETQIKEGKVLSCEEVLRVRMKKRRPQKKRQQKGRARKKVASGKARKDANEISSDDECDLDISQSQQLHMDRGTPPPPNVRRSSRISSRKRDRRKKTNHHSSVSFVPIISRGRKSKKSPKNLLSAKELKILERFPDIEWGTPVVLVKMLTSDEIRVLTPHW